MAKKKKKVSKARSRRSRGAVRKGGAGERDLVDMLKKAGFEGAYRVSHAQRRTESGLPDVDGTPFFTENKNTKSLPATVWSIVLKCLTDRKVKQDPRPILVRLKKTGAKYPPLVVMLEEEWLELVNPGSSKSEQPARSTKRASRSRKPSSSR